MVPHDADDDGTLGTHVAPACTLGRPLAQACGKILPPMWILRTVTDDFPEQTFRILPGGVRTVGRAVGADFIVDAALVSRVHCRVTALPDGGLEVRDLESTNGTYVNGQRIETARLAPGDRLQLGRVEIVALRDELREE
jgi:pSer/pThr/pTyr-binding forkhead associated (FHA) protein